MKALFLLLNKVTFKSFLKDFRLLKLLSQYETKKIWFKKIVSSSTPLLRYKLSQYDEL